MNRNLGVIDRILRVLIGLATYALFVADITSGVLGIVTLILGTVFILTSFVSFCPLYKIIGLKSN